MNNSYRPRLVQVLRGSTTFSSMNHATTNTETKSVSPLVDYPVGWAWQTLLLHQRLRLRQQQQQQSQNATREMYENNSNSMERMEHWDYDQLLVLEHTPVYTLGRGSDIQHLTSLVRSLPSIIKQQQPQHPNTSTSTMEVDTLLRHCLTGRGAGTIRLGASSRGILDALVDGITSCPHQPDDALPLPDHQQQQQQLSSTTMRNAVNLLLQDGGTSPILVPPYNIPIYRVERGGQVTYHGPGQVVVYPLFDLSVQPPYKSDLHWFLRQMEQVLIDSLVHEYGLKNVSRDDQYTGVWVNGQRKIASIGITASRWITSHGLAVNVHPDLTHFDAIRPCGIHHRTVTSLREELDSSVNSPSISQFTECLLYHFAKRFNVQLVEEEKNGG